MPKDARWGLVLGTALVIVIAVLFFRNDGPGVGGSASVPGTGRVDNLSVLPVPGVPGVPASRTHRVKDGETLTSIAAQYYGDPRHVLFLYRANQDQLLAPDRVPVGTLLLVPEGPPALTSQN